jgi:hypothetical protein
MAFGKKLQDVFKLLIDDIKKLGSKFDFFTEAKALEKYLADAGVTNIKAPQFIAEVFDELEAPRSGWKPIKDDIVSFFKTLPDRIKKEKITDEILVKYVPKEDWGLFKKDWANAALAYKGKLGSFPPMISKKDGDKIILSVFLGDIREKLGIRESELKGYTYKHVYSAVDENIGRNIVLSKLKGRLPKSKIKILDYPNASCLHDARYEFEIDRRDSTGMPLLIAKAAVLSALRDVGVIF